MRIGNVVLLVRFLFLFIGRRVLGRGILARPSARYAALVLAAIAFVGYCIFTAFVLRNYFDAAESLEMILIGSGVSVPFWVTVIYTVTRVLFLKADSLVHLTFILPATNRERTLAFAIFEVLIVFVALTATLGAIVVASVIIGGLDIVGTIALVIALPALSCYFLLSLAYLSFERLLLRLGIARIRALLVPFALAAALVLSFGYVSEQTQLVVTAIFLNEPIFVPQLVFLWIDERLGGWMALTGFLVLSAVMLGGIGLAAPRSYVPVKRNFRVLESRFTSSKFVVYTLALSRSFETLMVLTVTLAVSGAILFISPEIPPFALLLMTFQGVYAFAGSEPIRYSTPNMDSPTRQYMYLVGSQAVLFLAVSVPIIALSVLQGSSSTQSLLIVGFGLMNIVLTTTVGVLFPPHNGNPFSVVVGMMLMMIVVGAFTLSLNVFGLPLPINILAVVTLSVILSVYSVIGITRVESLRRHEMVS